MSFESKGGQTSLSNGANLGLLCPHHDRMGPKAENAPSFHDLTRSSFPSKLRALALGVASLFAAAPDAKSVALPQSARDAVLERVRLLVTQPGDDRFMVRERGSDELKRLASDAKTQDRARVVQEYLAVGSAVTKGAGGAPDWPQYRKATEYLARDLMRSGVPKAEVVALLDRMADGDALQVKTNPQWRLADGKLNKVAAK